MPPEPWLRKAGALCRSYGNSLDKRCLAVLRSPPTTGHVAQTIEVSGTRQARIGIGLQSWESPVARLPDNPASVWGRHAGDAGAAGTRLSPEFHGDMDEQGDEDDRPAGDGARRRHLVMDQPYPYRSEQRLERAEQGSNRRRDKPCAGC